MIVRLSQKLAKKVKVAPTRVLPPDTNPFADWSGHLFTATRAQYVLLTNTASLYSVVMHGAGISSDSRLLDRGLDAIREFMSDDGQEFIYQRFVAPSTELVHFSKALNRSIIGSMNDLVYHAQFWLVERELSPFDAAGELNDVPMSVLGYRCPREVFKSLASRPQAVQ